jgi:two-component system response regulator BaeR
MTAPLILIAEDEKKIAEVIRDYLVDSGYRTHVFNTGTGVVNWVRDNAPDLLLLDIMLPGTDGLTLCREVRAFSDVPVVMVTARVEEIDRLLGLELGADDYVCKPFSPRELVARIKAILRRSMPLSAPAPASALSMDEERFEARLGDSILPLTVVEFRLLQALAAHPGRVYSRQALMDAAYTDHRVVSDRTIDSHVKNLRRKLSDASGDELDPIRSIYGVGYKLDLL